MGKEFALRKSGCEKWQPNPTDSESMGPTGDRLGVADLRATGACAGFSKDLQVGDLQRGNRNTPREN
jgi:hypothetical protein